MYVCTCIHIHIFKDIKDKKKGMAISLTKLWKLKADQLVISDLNKAKTAEF